MKVVELGNYLIIRGIMKRPEDGTINAVRSHSNWVHVYVIYLQNGPLWHGLHNRLWDTLSDRLNRGVHDSVQAYWRDRYGIKGGWH